jgi:hypothetical protein
LAVQGILTGGVLGLLLYPVSILAIVQTGRAIGEGHFAPGPAGWALLAINGFNLLAILSGATIAALRGLSVTRRPHRVWLILLLPIYWGLISLAAWQALFELMRRPWRWEKTTHGVAKDRRLILADHAGSAG